MKLRRVIVIFGKILLLFGILAGINFIMTFVFVPADGFNGRMWATYEDATDVDTIYVGSSVTLAAFDTFAIDKIAGTKSINLGILQQDISQSKDTIELALSQREIKMVILGLQYFSLQFDSDEGSAVNFRYELANHQEHLLGRLSKSAAFVTQKERISQKNSINYFLPWVNNHVDIYGSAIIANVKNKLNGNTSKPREEFEKIFWGHDYHWYMEEYNSVDNYGKVEIPEESLEVLKEIAELCNQYGCELIVVNTPRPPYDVIRYGDIYYEDEKLIRAVLEENGAEYYDFEFITPELFDVTEPEYYYDFEHLNVDGTDAFSEGFAKFLVLRKEQVDLSEWFISREEFEKIASKGRCKLNIGG